MVNTLEGKLSQDTVHVVGATGVSTPWPFFKPLKLKLGNETQPFFQPLKLKLGKHWVTHQFFYMPNSPKTLLGKDLLEKLEAGNKFKKGKGV